MMNTANCARHGWVGYEVYPCKPVCPHCVKDCAKVWDQILPIAKDTKMAEEYAGPSLRVQEEALEKVRELSDTLESALKANDSALDSQFNAQRERNDALEDAKNLRERYAELQVQMNTDKSVTLMEALKKANRRQQAEKDELQAEVNKWQSKYWQLVDHAEAARVYPEPATECSLTIAEQVEGLRNKILELERKLG